MKRYLMLILVLSISSILMSCDTGTHSLTDSSNSGGDPDPESVEITNAVEGDTTYPSDADAVEADELTVDGENVSGTDATRLEDTESPEADVSVTIPESLSRANGDIVRFGYWYKHEDKTGQEFYTARVESVSLLYEAMEIIFPGAVDRSVSGKIKVSNYKLKLNRGENYFCFYFEDSAGNKYRTPVMAITYELEFDIIY
jgi:hypothetical protein